MLHWVIQIILYWHAVCICDSHCDSHKDFREQRSFSFPVNDINERHFNVMNVKFVNHLYILYATYVQLLPCRRRSHTHVADSAERSRSSYYEICSN
jgi:hypothetical protein